MTLFNILYCCKRIIGPVLALQFFLTLPYNIKERVLMVFSDEIVNSAFASLPCLFIHLFIARGRGFLKLPFLIDVLSSVWYTVYSYLVV